MTGGETPQRDSLAGGIAPHRERPFVVGERVLVIDDVTNGVDIEEYELPYVGLHGTVVKIIDTDYWTTVVKLVDGRIIHFDPKRELQIANEQIAAPIDMNWGEIEVGQ